MDQIDKRKSKTYGGDYLKSLNDEIAALRTMNGLQKTYLKDVQANIQANSKLLSEAAKDAGLTLQFNEDGSIANFNELMTGFIQQYNAAMTKFNNLSAKEQEKAENKRYKEEWDERYEEWKKLISDYEEDAELLQTIQSDILENQNQISEKLKEVIQQKIELQFNLDDRELAQIDRWLGRWEDDLDEQANRIPALMQKLDSYVVTDETGKIVGGQLALL